MYNNYYSSSDVQVYITNSDFTKIVKLDTTLSIGYSVRQTKTPIYSLGSRKVQFFSSGNTLGQGTITIAFTDVEYLKACITEIDNSSQIGYYQDTVDKGTNNSDISNTDFKKKSKDKKVSSISVDGRTISIGAISTPFNLSLYLNNETAINSSKSSVINLIGVEIIEEQNETSSTKDSPLMITYNIIFRDIERG